MKSSKSLSLLLGLCGLLAIGIGASILFAPIAFHAANGIAIVADANLLSELRAPGGALALLGVLMLAGVYARSFRSASVAIAATVYLGYGMSRLLGIALDGIPDAGMLVAAIVEIIIGTTCAVAWAARFGRPHEQRPLRTTTSLDEKNVLRAN